MTVKNKHKGRKRKIESTQKKHAHHKQRLIHKLQQQRLQQYRSGEAAASSTTPRTSSTTQTDADWSMSENWWGNFTDDYNNSTYNNNTDYGSNEWLSVDPSPVSPLFQSTLVAANEVSDSEESLGYFSSSTMSSDLDSSKSSTEPFESTPSVNSWSSTSYTSLDIDFDSNQENSSSESDTMSTEVWSSATPVLNFSPTTKVTLKQAQKGAVIETTTSTNDNDNSTNQFDLFTDSENSEASVSPTLNSFVINSNQGTTTTTKQTNRRKLQRGRSNSSSHKSNKFVRKFAQPAATNAALTTKMHRASTPFLQTWSTRMTTTPTTTTKNPLGINKINNIIQINKNISEPQTHNSLSEKLEPSTRRASFSTMATTKDKSVRKSTQKLLATPFHQLIQYVRNDAGEIDIDNIDNISIYPEVSEESDIDYSAAQGSTKIMPHRRLAIVSGYLPTSASVVLPESIQIAKIKINKERKRMLRQRRRHGETDRILA